MKRFLKYLSIILVTLVITIFILLRQPAFQDRLLESAIENLAAPSSYLPEEDALTGVVCGSRAPIPAPDRAETCILIQAGDNILMTGTRHGIRLREYFIPTCILTISLISLIFIKQLGSMAEENLSKKYMGLRGFKCLQMV
jgi:hypothetical protein